MDCCIIVSVVQRIMSPFVGVSKLCLTACLIGLCVFGRQFIKFMSCFSRGEEKDANKWMYTNKYWERRKDPGFVNLTFPKLW